MLRARAGVEAQDEVVPDVVRRLQLAHGFGQQERAPVGHAADYAVGVEHDLAGGFGDSVGLRGELVLEKV